MNQPYRVLYRSRTNRMLGGVAGGLGEYLNIDPTLVRVLLALGSIAGWFGPIAIAYLVMLIAIPEEPLPGTVPAPQAARPAAGEPAAPWSESGAQSYPVPEAASMAGELEVGETSGVPEAQEATETPPPPEA